MNFLVQNIILATETKYHILGTFLVVQWFKNPASSAGDIVSLVRKLRPHLLWGNQAQAPQATTKQAQSGVHMPQPERSLPLQQKIPHATTRPNAAQKIRENFK